MPSNEIKRQFTLGKMEKDKDDRLVEPGAYRDANNVDVSRSEGDDSGALQVVRGNRLVADQTINWEVRRMVCELPDDPTPEEQEAYDNCIALRNAEIVKPFGETVGVYAYPQEEKIYFFNTGRPVDPDNPDIEQPLQNAIYEYDQVNDTVSPILIETDTGDYEAGGGATMEFIGELLNTQVWSKTAYQDNANQSDDAFFYNREATTDTDFQSIITLTCSSSIIVDRDDDDNIIYHIDGDYCADVCTDPNAEDCSEASLFWEAIEGEAICRINGDPNEALCDCATGGDDCEYVQLTDCPITGGVIRTEEDCVSQEGNINPDINSFNKTDLVLEYQDAEYPVSNWTITPDPDTSIQYQLITNVDLDQDPVCTPKTDFPNYLGFEKYTLNGNGADLQPEEFCDPRCEIFQPADCTPDASNNYCYPEYCEQTPVLNSKYETQLTEAAEGINATRIITMTDVPNVGEGEIIQATLKAIVPATTDIPATFNGVTEQWEFDPTEDSVLAENAIIIRNMDALDFQQLDSIFGNVGLASRPVGYTYRVAREGNLSWTPNSDEAFDVQPDDPSEVILGSNDPLDFTENPPLGGQGQNLVFDVEVDRQQNYIIETDEIDREDFDVNDRTE